MVGWVRLSQVPFNESLGRRRVPPFEANASGAASLSASPIEMEGSFAGIEYRGHVIEPPRRHAESLQGFGSLISLEDCLEATSSLQPIPLRQSILRSLPRRGHGSNIPLGGARGGRRRPRLPRQVNQLARRARSRRLRHANRDNSARGESEGGN